jgi:hypothetical protein
MLLIDSLLLLLLLCALYRAMTSNWRTFKTRSLEEDAVVFLWDILYQVRGP